MGMPILLLQAMELFLIDNSLRMVIGEPMCFPNISAYNKTPRGVFYLVGTFDLVQVLMNSSSKTESLEFTGREEAISMESDKKIKKDSKKKRDRSKSHSDRSCFYVIDPCGCNVDPCGCYASSCCC